MGKLYYKAGTKHIPAQVIDVAELIVKMHEDRATLIKWLNEIQTSLDSEDHVTDGDKWRMGILVAPRYADNWQKYGTVQLSRASNPTVHTIELSKQLRDRLQSFLHMNDAFQFSLYHDTVNLGDRFIGVLEANTISLFTVIDGIECPKCGDVVESSDLIPHQATYTCPMAEGKLAVKKNGYVKVHGQDALALRRAINMPSMIIPEMYGVFAPQWVMDAILNFHKTGYADLTLEEFLGKLAGPPPAPPILVDEPASYLPF